MRTLGDDQLRQGATVDPVIKVVFGWKAWVLLFLIIGGLGSSIDNAVSNTVDRSQRDVGKLEQEIDRLNTEIQALQSQVDLLVKKSNNPSPDSE